MRSVELFAGAGGSLSAGELAGFHPIRSRGMGPMGMRHHPRKQGHWLPAGCWLGPWPRAMCAAWTGRLSPATS